jgi:hypothetical protein
VPRISAEARSAAAWRHGDALPSPPGYLSDGAKGVWVEIVSSRSSDYFDPATLCMLETFCCAAAELRRMWTRLQNMEPRDPGHGELVRLISTMGGALSTMATRLRLCHSSRLSKESGILDERRPSPSRDRRLLGLRKDN